MNDNKLIAEFMGAKPIVLGNSTEYEMYGILECINDGVDEKHFFIDDEMEFHECWKWLMPVVEKIEEQHGCDFTASRRRVTRTYDANFMDEVNNYVAYVEDCKDRQEATYKAVVEFIKQLNKEL